MPFRMPRPTKEQSRGQRIAAASNRGLGPKLNFVGDERAATPITLPQFTIMAEALPDDNSAKAAAIVKLRIIRAGRDAWQEIAKSESFEAWVQIGAALVIGKQHALRLSRGNAPWGRNYCREFAAWAAQMGFAPMRASDRSYAIALSENLGSITAFRAGLSDRERGRLVTAQSNVKRWKASTEHRRHQCPSDLKRRATMHWRRFFATFRMLEPKERGKLWHASLAEMAGL